LLFDYTSEQFLNVFGNTNALKGLINSPEPLPKFIWQTSQAQYTVTYKVGVFTNIKGIEDVKIFINRNKFYHSNNSNFPVSACGRVLFSFAYLNKLGVSVVPSDWEYFDIRGLPG
jgi:hypothetical protein